MPPVESAEDRAAMLQDFGVRVTITPASGLAWSFLALFDRESIEVPLEGVAPDVDSREPLLMARSADCSSATQGDAIAIEGESDAFEVQRNLPTGDGFTVLVLRSA